MPIGRHIWRHSAGGREAREGTGNVALATDDGIRQMLAERVDAIAGHEDGIGIVVGVIEPTGRRIVSYGHRLRGDSRPLDGDTVFEIASVTKVFTALLLAEMARRGEVVLTAPVATYLPVDCTVPERDGRSITLLDLAMHTAGLPFMPDALPASAASAMQITTQDLKRYLAGYRLPHDIGTTWDYSNLGYWLLGEALTHQAARSFDRLLRERVLAPLKLKSTALTPSPWMRARLALGHDAALQVAPAVNTLPIYALMPASGGLYSTVNDLLRLLAVAVGRTRSPLAQALTTCLSVSRPKPSVDEAQALGWVVIGTGEDRVFFHDGGTFGYASCVGFDPVRRVGVVVLSTSVMSVADIGRHLLQPSFPLARPVAARRTEISLDVDVLDRYVGHYESPGEGIFTLTRDGTHLVLESPAEWGLPNLRLRPESRADFFAAELPLRVTVQVDGDGRATGLLVYPPRGQEGHPAARID